MKKTIRESMGVLSVDEFFNDYAQANGGRSKRLDVKFKRQLIDGLSEFLNARKRNMTPEEFVNAPPPKCDMLMSEFERWMKKNKGIDIYQNFDDYYMRDKVSGDDVTTYDVDTSEMNGKTRWSESHDDIDGSIMDEQDIIDWIGSEIKDCEWCTDMTYDDYDPILEIEVDGKRFEISVKPIE